MSQPELNVQAITQNVDWEEVTERLLLFAHKLAGTNALPRGISPEDLVYGAIAKFLQGQRKWDPGKVGLLEFLFGVIRSDLSHLLEGSWREHAVPGEDQQTGTFGSEGGSEEEGGRRGREITARPKNHSQKTYIPEDDPQNPYNHVREARERAMILAFVRSDPFLYQIVLLVLDEGLFKPQEIALRLGCSEREVNNAKRRLRRALSALREGPAYAVA